MSNQSGLFLIDAMKVSVNIVYKRLIYRSVQIILLSIGHCVS